VAQLLLEHEVEPRAVGGDLPPQLAFAVQHPRDELADEVHRRVAAGDDGERDGGEDLFVVEPAAALVVLRAQEVADEVALGARRRPALGDQLVHERLEVRLPVSELDERVLVERRVAHEPHRVPRPGVQPVLHGGIDAEDGDHHAHRAAPCEHRQEVRPPLAGELVDGRIEELPDALLVGQRRLAGERALGELADPRVLVRVVPGQHAGAAPEETLRQHVRGPRGHLLLGERQAGEQPHVAHDPGDVLVAGDDVAPERRREEHRRLAPRDRRERAGIVDLRAIHRVETVQHRASARAGLGDHVSSRHASSSPLA